MDYTDRELVRVRNALLCISGIAWVALLFWPGMSSHCTAMASGSTSWRELLEMPKAINALASLEAGWFLMLVAMMAPMLISPANHIRMQSFRHRRLRSIGLFLIGYFGIWLAAGVVLMSTELQAESIVRPLYLSMACVAVVLIWQFSPVKQYCLNRVHLHPRLAAFGQAADHAALRFGVGHGIWCVGSCWAMMVLPMLLSRGHVGAMLTVSILTFSERLEKPAWPCWSWRLSGKLMRVIIAQSRIRLRTNGPSLVGLSR